MKKFCGDKNIMNNSVNLHKTLKAMLLWTKNINLILRLCKKNVQWAVYFKLRQGP